MRTSNVRGFHFLPKKPHKLLETKGVSMTIYIPLEAIWGIGGFALGFIIGIMVWDRAMTYTAINGDDK